VWAIGFRQAMRSSDNGEDAELSANFADPPNSASCRSQSNVN
jgi:hypothetical protein